MNEDHPLRDNTRSLGKQKESDFEKTVTLAYEDPETFWSTAAKNVDWFSPWGRVFDDRQAPTYRWFTDGGTLNTCYNCLDRHVEGGHGDQVALIYDSPVTDTIVRFTYAELLKRVTCFAGAMADVGVQKGDRVLIYMPMVPEAVIGMLASARLGAIHSVVFGGFAAAELAARIADAKPKVILSASCGIEPGRIVAYKPLLDQAIELADHNPVACIILQRAQKVCDLIPDRDINWRAFEASGKPVACTPVAATDPLYIIYTSGTTGQPKGIVRDTGGHLVALMWSMKNIYGSNPGDVFWAASDIGWVVGHSYIVYGPLARRCTTILFEGKPVGTPDAAAFWRIIERHNVKIMFTAPTAIRAIKQQDPEGEMLKNFDITNLEILFLGGERGDSNTIQWAEDIFGVPVIDHWWQTETGWPITANCAGLGLYPVKHGSAGKAVPGFRVKVIDVMGSEVARGETGSIVIELPLPPGCLPTLWGDNEGYITKYLTEFPGHYLTGDAGFIDENGYISIMSRTDDVINVAGHRLSTGALEEIIADHRDVAECAVFGIADKLKGQIPLGLIVLKAGANRPEEEIVAELIQSVRTTIGPI